MFFTQPDVIMVICNSNHAVKYTCLINNNDSIMVAPSSIGWNKFWVKLPWNCCQLESFYFYFYFFIRRLNHNDLSRAILWLPCWNPEHLLLFHPTVVINLTSQLQRCFFLNLWKARRKCFSSRSNLIVWMRKRIAPHSLLSCATSCGNVKTY